MAITGAHFLFYSTAAEADRVFLRDVIGLPSLDIGHGWLLYALPPAELAVHPSDAPFVQPHAGHDLQGAVLYLMCDDLDTTMASLTSRGATCTEVGEASWGRFTTVPLPGGAAVGLYQPSHPVAIDRDRTAREPSATPRQPR